MSGGACVALPERALGILLHPTSLPGSGENGALGAATLRYLNFLEACGARVWQLLPVGPVDGGGSPYVSASAHAGDERLLDLADPPPESEAALSGARQDAYERFVDGAGHWLHDFALFAVIRSAEGGRPWQTWPEPLRRRDPASLRRVAAACADALAHCRLRQFWFERQWAALKAAANARGIRLFGDMPIYVAPDSADVWARPDLFRLDGGGRPTVVAGVPPDYFSDSGQLWGNPLYRWERHAADGFRWWRERLRTQLHRFDLLRIDHFRGFEACWEVPAGAVDARIGHWQPAPGDALFAALQDEFGELPLVAEDLGVITPAVDALRRRLGLPGMRVLQFAFDDGAGNVHLPHHHEPCAVVYTGTHDNDTTLGWFQGLDDARRRRVYGYLGLPAEEMPWALIRCAMASVARLAVVPMQDVLGLDGGHRMNRPGVAGGNWRWRFQWEQASADRAARIHHLAAVYDRLRG